MPTFQWAFKVMKFIANNETFSEIVVTKWLQKRDEVQLIDFHSKGVISFTFVKTVKSRNIVEKFNYLVTLTIKEIPNKDSSYIEEFYVTYVSDRTKVKTSFPNIDKLLEYLNELISIKVWH